MVWGSPARATRGGSGTPYKKTASETTAIDALGGAKTRLQRPNGTSCHSEWRVASPHTGHSSSGEMSSSAFVETPRPRRASEGTSTLSEASSTDSLSEASLEDSRGNLTYSRSASDDGE